MEDAPLMFILSSIVMATEAVEASPGFMTTFTLIIIKPQTSQCWTQ